MQVGPSPLSPRRGREARRAQKWKIEVCRSPSPKSSLFPLSSPQGRLSPCLRIQRNLIAAETSPLENLPKRPPNPKGCPCAESSNSTKAADEKKTIKFSRSAQQSAPPLHSYPFAHLRGTPRAERIRRILRDSCLGKSGRENVLANVKLLGIARISFSSIPEGKL